MKHADSERSPDESAVAESIFRLKNPANCLIKNQIKFDHLYFNFRVMLCESTPDGIVGSGRKMKKKFILNDTVLFEPEKNSLTSLHATPVQKIILHTPASECLRQLLLHNDQVVSQKLLFEQVWEKNGAFVTVNTLYQNIVSVRKGLKAAGIAEDVIKTLPKTGFKISVMVKEINDEIATSPAEEKSERTKDNGDKNVKDEESVNENTRHSSRKTLFWFNKAFCLWGVIVALIFISLWAIFYQQEPAGRTYYAAYHFVGKVDGCQLYSSHPGDEKSRDMFSLLLSRYPVKCQPDSVVYMTINRMYEVSSIIACNKKLLKLMHSVSHSCSEGRRMKNKIHFIGWLVLTILMIIFVLFSSYVYYKNRYFSCEAELNIIMGSSNYNVIAHYDFAGGTGKYHALGVLRENGKPVLTVNKAFDFKYSKLGDSLMLMSVDNSPEPELLDTLIPDLPDFFSFSGRGLNVRLLQVNQFSYLFFHNNEPLFYCTRTNRGAVF